MYCTNLYEFYQNALLLKLSQNHTEKTTKKNSPHRSALREQVRVLGQGVGKP